MQQIILCQNAKPDVFVVESCAGVTFFLILTRMSVSELPQKAPSPEDCRGGTLSLMVSCLSCEGTPKEALSILMTGVIFWPHLSLFDQCETDNYCTQVY